jgi:anaerobic selenocysteine-containing dehydrogenase
MLVTLAAMHGQTGLPGGGFGFSYPYAPAKFKLWGNNEINRRLELQLPRVMEAAL